MSEKGSLYKILKVKEIKQQTEGFKTFVFEGDAGISYQPGQYLTFVHTFEGQEIRRSYSITSVPQLNEPLSIGVKRVENGVFSRYMIDRVQPGDTLVTTGAAGLFTLPEDIQNYTRLFFLAAGSGITPVFSLIKSALHQYAHLQVVLIYSNPSEKKTAFYKELLQQENQFPHRLKTEFLYSLDKNLVKARLYRDLLHSFVNAHTSGDSLAQILFYTCGPEAYMRMCIFALKEINVPDEHIKRENFNTTKPPPKAEIPDKNSYWTHIQFKDRHYDFKVNYPDTILAAAKKEGIQLPYSCETGRCASCVMRCTQGTVWMANNEVLTPKDLHKGLVLTCTGHPTGGDIVLEG